MQADFLALRRAGWVAFAQPLAAPALLVAACAILAGVALYSEYAWCTGVGAMLALAGSFALTRSRLMSALVRARFGWAGALPVRDLHVRSTLLVLAAVALAVAVVSGSLLLWLAALAAPHPVALPLAWLALDGGLVVGTFAAAVLTLRKGAVERSRHADGIREPLFALPWLDDACLPHLLDWQRRAALVRWRRGGSFVLVGCALAAVPDGAAIPGVAGMVLWMLSLVWFEVVLRTSAAVTADARHLLGATPLQPGRIMRWVALRYPLFAAACVLILGVAGVILLGGGFLSVVAWVACAVAVSAFPLRRIFEATKSGSRA